MIYDNRCFSCQYRESRIEPEIMNAKKFHDRTSNSWKFSCGAYYSKDFLNRYGVEIYPKDCMLNEEEKSKEQRLKELGNR